MTTLTSTRPDAPAVRPAPRLALFATAAAQFVLMLGAFGVLSSAIGWPQSLDLPAAEALPLIRERGGAVALGYSMYFVSAFLLVPLSVLIHRMLGEQDGDSTVLNITAALGVTAGVLKLLGIVRWLVAMPALAATYAGGDGATQAAASVMYETLNTYAGGVGEALGVQLFAGLWTVMVSAALWRRPGARALALGGFASGGLLLAGLAGVFGADLGPVLTVSGIAWQVWLLSLGLNFLRARR
ncbi:DUF4386 family protein [Deinococcus koreensis]|uniref:DUF4386 domain-containing protein n=1 Tax=Deinococcus koreensis TaxID=2054903 RepID=A0A2K3UTD6_9DEIO|nr:DUF4386 family protein [Deinococcus koreensis]PNY79805.1 hypothetical protein CVO96_17840 [Deinococcus koreensis]